MFTAKSKVIVTMLSMTILGKNVSVFPSENPDAPAIYLNTVSEEGQ